MLAVRSSKSLCVSIARWKNPVESPRKRIAHLNRSPTCRVLQVMAAYWDKPRARARFPTLHAELAPTGAKAPSYFVLRNGFHDL